MRMFCPCIDSLMAITNGDGKEPTVLLFLQYSLYSVKLFIAPWQCVPGYETIQIPYGYFLDLSIRAKGHPLARIYKAF